MSPVSPSPSPQCPVSSGVPWPYCNCDMTWHLKTPATLLPPIWPLIPPSKECGDCEENHELPDNLKLLHTQLQMWNTHTHASATHNMLLSRVAVSLKTLLRAKRSRLELPPGWTLSTDFHPILMQVSPHIHFTLSNSPTPVPLIHHKPIPKCIIHQTNFWHHHTRCIYAIYVL